MNGQLFNLETPQPLAHLVAGEFTGNGGSDPLAASFTTRDIVSVTRIAAGTYEVTLRHTWPAVLARFAHAVDATPDVNGIAQIVSDTISTNGKFIVKYRVDGVDTNADSSVKIAFMLFLSNRRP
jgi:hypothetical protein